MLWDLVGIWGFFGGGLWDLGADRVNLGCFLGSPLVMTVSPSKLGGASQGFGPPCVSTGIWGASVMLWDRGSMI